MELFILKREYRQIPLKEIVISYKISKYEKSISKVRRCCINPAIVTVPVKS